MLFYHEELDMIIKHTQRQLTRLLKQRKQADFGRASVLWDMAQSLPAASKYWNSARSLRVYLQGSFSIFAFDKLLDELDCIAEAAGYEFDCNLTRYSTWDNQYVLYYGNKEGKDLTLYIASSSCKSVPTGKMIPETKTQCNMVTA